LRKNNDRRAASAAMQRAESRLYGPNRDLDCVFGLERFPAKQKPVRRKKAQQTKKLRLPVCFYRAGKGL
jgi:hypothetical protein